MSSILLPAIWLIVIIVGLPQLSETVYTPSLPDIAKSLQTKQAMVEYTITIYLLGQSICRDAFHGPALGRVYSIIASMLGLFPALGPLCGGLIAELFGWRNIFVFLSLFALIVTFFVVIKLPETHPCGHRKQVATWHMTKQLLLDKKVLGFGLIVARCNGILFSYFAEGSFHLIKKLGLSPSHYGLSFTVIAISTMLGGIFSRKLHNNHHASKDIMRYGLFIMTLATTMFSLIALENHNLLPSCLLIS